MSAVTLPGTLPGLLRRGAPVVDVRHAEALHGKPITPRGVYVPSGPKGDEGMVLWDRSSGTRDRVEYPVYHGLLALDLTDPAGMDTAARWLAGKVGLTVGATAPEWRREMSYAEGERTHSWVLCVRLEWARDSWACFHSEGEDSDGAVKWVLVPGISDITDPREALRLACVAVGGAQ